MNETLYETKLAQLSDVVRRNVETCREDPEAAGTISSDELKEVCEFAARFPEEPDARNAYRAASDILGDREEGVDDGRPVLDTSAEGSAVAVGTDPAEIVSYVEAHGFRLTKEADKLSVDEVVAMQAFFEPTREGAEMPIPSTLERVEAEPDASLGTEDSDNTGLEYPEESKPIPTGEEDGSQTDPDGQALAMGQAGETGETEGSGAKDEGATEAEAS